MNTLALVQNDFYQVVKNLQHQIQSPEAIKWLTIVSVLVFALIIAPDTMAGNTGAEFKPAWDKFEDLIGGFGGKMIAGVSLAIALIGSALRFNPYLVFGALGTGITAAFGTAVLGKVVTAII